MINDSLTPEQNAFLAQHHVALSDGYVGMLRAYRDNRTVWQTSPMNVILGGIAQGQGGPKVDWDQLDLSNREQLRAWVNELMTLSDAEVTTRLSVTVPYLS